jgi:esterase
MTQSMGQTTESPTLFSRVLENPGAPPLVILHGLLGSSDNWQTLAKRYQSDFEVHLLDARNHGRSPHVPTHTYAAMAADVLRYLEDRGCGQVRLLGHSMGGKTVLQLLHQAPERIARLVVADIAARAYPPHHQPIFDALLGCDLAILTEREAVEAQLMADLGDAGVVAFLMKGLHRLKTGGLAWRANLPVLQAHLPDILVSIPLDVHTLPLLLIYGEQSNYVGAEDLAYFDRHCMQLETHGISGAGHWLHAEAPDEFYEVTRQFLKG